jgi:lysophospholipase L1-like esterase
VSAPASRPTAGRGRTAVLLAVAAATALLACEGLASCLLVAGRLLRAEPIVKERAHCRYDETLGWVQLPDLDLADQYGPGVFLRTNARGFRGRRDVATDVPAGRVRVVCSGDSFTLGYGVDDDHAWCELLTTPRRETVNMGQGGYGVDQAYLWYRRDGEPLAHHAHVFAVDTLMFDRMRFDAFLGYGRPVLRLVDDALVVTNAPIPRRGYLVPWLTQSASVIAELRTMQLLSKVVALTRPAPARRPTADVRTIAARMIADLRAVNERKGSRLVLLYLPIPSDYDRGDSEPWRRWLRNEAAREGLPYVDLVDEWRQSTETEWQALFSGESGHFSVAGNRRVAERIGAELDRVLDRP